jgi:hypothetical protein
MTREDAGGLAAGDPEETPMKKLAALLILLAMISSAQAAILDVTYTQEYLGQNEALGTDLTKIVFTASVVESDDPTDPNASGLGVVTSNFSGQLAQLWGSDGFGGVLKTIKVDPTVAVLQDSDSHIYHVEGFIGTVGELIENKSPDGTGAGFGTELKGTISFGGVPESIEFAQIIVPAGSSWSGDFVLANGRGVEQNVEKSGVAIPEPATLSLLAIGGVGALVRRRR